MQISHANIKITKRTRLLQLHTICSQWTQLNLFYQKNNQNWNDQNVNFFS